MDCELDMLGATDFEKAVLMDAAIKQQQARQASSDSKPSAQDSAASSLAVSIAIMIGLLGVGAVAAIFGQKR